MVSVYTHPCLPTALGKQFGGSKQVTTQSKSLTFGAQTAAMTHKSVGLFLLALWLHQAKPWGIDLYSHYQFSFSEPRPRWTTDDVLQSRFQGLNNVGAADERETLNNLTETLCFKVFFPLYLFVQFIGAISYWCATTNISKFCVFSTKLAC